MLHYQKLLLLCGSIFQNWVLIELILKDHVISCDLIKILEEWKDSWWLCDSQW